MSAIYPLSVAQYHALGRAGILKSGDPVELLEGILVQKMAKSPPHVVSTGLMRDAVVAALPAGWSFRAHNPITLDNSEPEPDGAVARGGVRDYPNCHPGPAEVALVVEVADCSLDQDRGIKKHLYARNGIPTYWIVNLVDTQVEVYTGPTGSGDTADYAQRQDFRRGDSIPLVIAGGQVALIPVADLLP
jgi:Uma2 family endonuclease